MKRKLPSGGTGVIFLTAALLALTALPAGAAGPPRSAPPGSGSAPTVTVKGGETKPVFSRADAVTQTVMIETTVDSDRDGVRDRVQMRIMRPKETDTAGLKVPTIMEASPYWAGTHDVPMHPVDVDDAQGRSLAPPFRSLAEVFPGYYDNYFLPRGYAIANLDSIGTGGSTGCPTSGDRSEQAGAKAAVDWLNGRARGWAPDGTPVKASWSTGNVGMIGQSYNGTLPNMAAATGVEGLKAIVPIAGISNWYDYYRAGGGVVAPGGFQGEDLDILAKVVLTRDNPEVCKKIIDEIAATQDRETGDYGKIWAERDYVDQARKVRAAVMVVHGVNDWNVKVKNSVQWWNALKTAGVPRKLWLHQASHATPFRWRVEEWLRQTHHWFDRYLYGIRNGVEREPRVDVEKPDGTWETAKDWPVPGTRTVDVSLNAGPEGQPGTLGLRSRSGETQTFTDAGRTRTAEELLVNENKVDPNRLAYLTGPLRGPVRVNGIPSMSVRASLDGRSPYLTALLVDYGTDSRPTGARTNTDDQVCFGETVTGDVGCTIRQRHRMETAPYKIITRGWLDVRNRRSISRSEPIKPGKSYTFRWDLEPTDYVVKPGHRLGVILLSTDYDYTLRHRPGTEVAVRPGVSKIMLPLARGGREVLG
ncbi:dipeptidyl-peptidase IV [Actinomadura pelletieri DSM 43383]|uniref:Xaa-Pro dipeptidyl-peptidase n=1 Tax=Actinomadura pelletieri DSM 43383 TaxID=1120940 RepID=A0A495QLM2_9ACTN|nr:Xaa-Pro dipeptidyl-peptidase [Actinomadura pelletieri]RKS73331.1 dipeptidyl-peptidase IV [Actinomadura pelletieri DSM 43383]